MHPDAPALPGVVGGPTTGTRGQLALSVQEALTAVVRLRENRQVPTDASVFRTQMKTLLGQADREARGAGYPPEFVKLAVYAVIAFLDESVLNSSPGSMGPEWAGRPLQEEIFGEHLAGENFFAHLSDLLSRQDSAYVADIVEVYALCLYLGFKGKYGSSDGAELRSLMGAASEKIQRIRGGRGALSPRGLPAPDEAVIRPGDPLLRKMGLGLVAMVGIVLLLVVILRFFILSPGVREIQQLVG